MNGSSTAVTALVETIAALLEREGVTVLDRKPQGLLVQGAVGKYMVGVQPCK